MIHLLESHRFSQKVERILEAVQCSICVERLVPKNNVLVCRPWLRDWLLIAAWARMNELQYSYMPILSSTRLVGLGNSGQFDSPTFHFCFTCVSLSVGCV